jgi:hypothetical protein
MKKDERGQQVYPGDITLMDFRDMVLLEFIISASSRSETVLNITLYEKKGYTHFMHKKDWLSSRYYNEGMIIRRPA